MTKQAGGFFERVQGKIHPVTVEYFYGPRIAKTRPSFPYLVKVLQAHVVMLGQCSIIPSTAAGQLLTVLCRLNGKKADDLKLDPKLEDLYVNLENILTRELGSEVSSYLPVARSRNDVEAAMWRIELREKLATLAHSVLTLVRTICDRAEEQAASPMPGYTYDQQAQPVTMGFQLSAVSSTLLRDAARVLDCIKRLDFCPLGAAALAGTGYLIDRTITARLLGFAGALEHSLDAVASVDYMIEASGAAAICMNTLARFAEDLIKWCSNEVAFAFLPDNLIDSSSIMPQKRNPVIVATVRTYSRLMAGKVAGICTAGSVGFGASRDVTVAWEDVLECVDTTNGMTRITEACISGLKFDPAAMERALNIGFINSTEVADTLARDGGMSFRTAHQVVGAAVADLYDKGLGQQEFTYDRLNSWCQRITGASLPVTKAQIEQALDNKVGVERRKSLGGTAPSEVRRMIADQRTQTDNLYTALDQLVNQWQQADLKLQQESQQLMP